MTAAKDVLTTIQQWDPDGWTYREPTERDREQFRNRVIARFGRKAWEDYNYRAWVDFNAPGVPSIHDRY